MRAAVYKSVGWKPLIDLTATLGGANSVAPLYYDARANALKQASRIAGLDVSANPPFNKEMMTKFARLLVEA